MNTSSLSNYSPEDVIIVVGLLHTITGYVAGSFVTIDKASPTWTVRESADGVASRTLNPSKLYVVRLSLTQASDSNTVLSWMHNADRITGGRAKFPVMVKDASGSSTMFSAEAWISGVPSSAFSDSVESREWEITCAVATNHVGGNSEESSILEDLAGIGGGLLGSIV